jgi:hypothetical protein
MTCSKKPRDRYIEGDEKKNFIDAKDMRAGSPSTFDSHEAHASRENPFVLLTTCQSKKQSDVIKKVVLFISGAFTSELLICYYYFSNCPYIVHLI